jgi:hypothetical protein
VALVACINSTDGVWSVAKGNESGIKISGLGRGEYVTLHMELNGTKESVNLYECGIFPLPWPRMERYRVSKLVNPGVIPAPTTVEITLNGNAQSICRNTDNPIRTDTK